MPAAAYAPPAEGFEPSPVSHSVSHLAFDAGTSANDVAFLAVGTSDGAVTLLNVTLWRGEHVIAGKKLKVGPRDTSPPVPFL
jgi:hypothetical protein